MKKFIFFLLVSALFIYTAACSSGSKEDISELESRVDELNEKIQNDSGKIEDLNEILDDYDKSGVIAAAIRVMAAISEKDMQGLSSYVHPVKGVLFSPYGHIDTSSAMIFTQDQVKQVLSSDEVYTWGAFDATGDKIEMKFEDYYDRFVYDHDFIQPHVIGINVPVGKGNTVENIDEVFPEGVFVEFHFTGFDSRYEGMDWSSLRLVFEKFEDVWYVIAIIHDEWTI